MQQTIRFIKSADGTRLAVASSGSGPPLVKSANWLSHLEFDWASPVWRHWFRFLSVGRQLIRFDPRGCGLSDWDVADLSHAAQVADLEAIIDASDLDTFPLLGLSQGGAACIEYAVRHPERVTQLILYGCYAEGWAQRGDESRRHGEALIELIRQGWGQENPAFRQLFASLFIPDATTEQVRWFADLMRTTTQPEIAARILKSFGEINVRALLPQVKVPTVVVHARGDARIPFEQGRTLAAEIPNASFVALESRNHILTETEPAWARFCATFNEIMGTSVAPDGGSGQAAPVDLVELTARENAILRLVAQGAANGEIARRLFISEKTVRNHLTNVFEELSDLYRDVFRFHWLKECQHAVMDEIEWCREHRNLTAAERDIAVDDFIALLRLIDDVVRTQSSADAGYFMRLCDRSFSPAEQQQIRETMLRAYRWQYIVSGSQHPQFIKMISGMTTRLQIQRINAALAPMVGA